MSTGYLPVEPETRTVHKYLYPERPSREITVCGHRCEWVRSIMFIKSDDPTCSICYPEGF